MNAMYQIHFIDIPRLLSK